MEHALPIPKGVYAALQLPDVEKEERLRVELSITLYARGILSFGKARELAQLSKWAFHELLTTRNITRHYDEEALDDDLAFGQS